ILARHVDGNADRIAGMDADRVAGQVACHGQVEGFPAVNGDAAHAQAVFQLLQREPAERGPGWFRACFSRPEGKEPVCTPGAPSLLCGDDGIISNEPLLPPSEKTGCRRSPSQPLRRPPVRGIANARIERPLFFYVGKLGWMSLASRSRK